MASLPHTHSKVTVSLATVLHQASSSREDTEVRLKVRLPANSVVTLSKATLHLSTLDLAHNIQDSMAHRLQVLLLASTAHLPDLLPDSMVHHLQVLLPDNTSLQQLISKRLRDLQHHLALAIFPAKSQT